MTVASSRAANPGPQIKHAELHRSLRKFGRHDLKEHYELFNDCSLGSTDIGGVSVDCKFVFSKTRLGVLRDETYPGGIIYMTLTINQPSEWRLKEATISVILKDKASALGVQSASRRARNRESVEIWKDCYGPKELKGDKTAVEIEKNLNAEPFVETVGVGVGLGNASKSSKETRTARWNFVGTAKPADATSSQYTTLQWTMSHDSLAHSCDAPARIQTAFAFSHNYQPFILRVKIDGKMRHLHRKYKEMVIGSLHKRPPMCVLFEFKDDKKYDANILDHAEGLNDEMMKAADKEKTFEIQPQTVPVDAVAEEDTIYPPPPDQSGTIARLQATYPNIINLNSVQIDSNGTIDLGQITSVSSAATAVEIKSQEKITKALQQLPAQSWWMIAVLLLVLRELSFSSPKQ
jgi:hypothetical protein